jgi:hypothetical protein
VEPDKNIKQELAELIADPEKVSLQHTAMLNELLQEYPYYQPLHLLLAKAGQGREENNGLAKASLYTNGQTLHRFLFEKKNPAEEDLAAEPAADDDPLAIGEDLPVVTDEPAAEEDALVSANAPAEDPLPLTDEQETFEEISEPIAVIREDKVPEEAEENIFEEIGEVDFNIYGQFSTSPHTADSADQKNPVISEDTSNRNDSAEETEALENITHKHSLEDTLVFESIVSSDFFAFEDNFTAGEQIEENPAVSPPLIEEHDEAAAAEVENGRVSNYHDDKLPYTFLWWLAKTRKAHQSTFQPYAVPKKGGAQELQQQYVEHIFHMQSHLTGNEALLDGEEPSRPVSKDFQIIESFIKNDPQITPPNAEQIDNENKARKSAEDQNDLVSETLANIYIEQMLYDKAIDTYEKLSLKFPEKSRYFADLIQSIEKKI